MKNTPHCSKQLRQFGTKLVNEHIEPQLVINENTQELMVWAKGWPVKEIFRLSIWFMFDICHEIIELGHSKLEIKNLKKDLLKQPFARNSDESNSKSLFHFPRSNAVKLPVVADSGARKTADIKFSSTQGQPRRSWFVHVDLLANLMLINIWVRIAIYMKLKTCAIIRKTTQAKLPR